MDSIEHYREAERLLGLPVDPGHTDALARAQVHADLAVAAAVNALVAAEKWRIRGGGS